MKLGSKGKMNANVVRSSGVPASVTVAKPKMLSTATNMSVSKPGTGTKNPAMGLRGPLTDGKSGGVIKGV